MFSFILEAGYLHAAAGFIVLHKLFPDKTGAHVFRHQQRDAGVDAQHVGVVPVGERIEGVDETVFAPGFFSEFFPHRALDANGLLRQEVRT